MECGCGVSVLTCNRAATDMYLVPLMVDHEAATAVSIAYERLH